MQTHRRLIRCLLTVAIAVPALCPSSLSQTRTRDIAQRTLPSVVLLVINTGRSDGVSYGSGFFVGPDVVATNHHVVEGAMNGYARIVGQETRYEIQGFVALDQATDLALVKLRGANGRPLVIADSNAIAIGDEVFAVGNPRGLEGTFSQGIVSSIRRDGADSLIQITAPISEGSSGGPVLNGRGEVVGVAAGEVVGGQALNFAIPASLLRSMLASRKPLITFAEALRGAGAGVAAEEASAPAPPARAKAPSLSTDEVSKRSAASIPVTPGAITQLSLRSDRGDSVGGGKSYLFKLSDGRFSSEARDLNRDGVPDYVKIEFKGQNNRWTLQFSTNGIDANLSYGTYENAQRSSFADGSPGLEVDGNGSGCGKVNGSFTVYDVQYDYSTGYPRVISFAATFEQHCGDSQSALKGTIYFNALPVDGVR